MRETPILVLALSVLCGCASYTGVVAPGDDLVDKANRPFAEKAEKEYREWQKFCRPVVIEEAEGVNLFLSPNYVPRCNNDRANELCMNIDTRRAMLQSAKATLRSIVQDLRSLNLLDGDGSPMVEVGVDPETPPRIYHITYNISNVDLQLRKAALGLVRVVSSSENKIAYEWVANASVEVRMIDPDGNAVFTFNSMGTLTQTDDGSLNPNMTMLEQAAVQGVKEAMKQYAYKFGPPIYVTDTCQNGEFVRINIGSDYGVRPGMRVEFIRHRKKAGLSGNDEYAEQRVGVGVVGDGGAPVQADCAWVHVDDFDGKNRMVFQWTSAKLIRDSELGFALPWAGFVKGVMK